MGVLANRKTLQWTVCKKLKFLLGGKIHWHQKQEAIWGHLEPSVNTFRVGAGSKCNICQQFQKETIQYPGNGQYETSQEL